MVIVVIIKVNDAMFLDRTTQPCNTVIKFQV